MSKIFLQTDSGVHPNSYSASIEGTFSGVKEEALEFDHSQQTSAQIKNT
jgi:hypothetical protein